jgi:nucleoporin GLE1
MCSQDIDAAIQEVAKKEAELRAAQLMAEQRKKEEDAARVAREEKAAQERKAESEKRAREAEGRLRQEREAKEAKEREEAEARVKAEEKEKLASARGNVGGEWRKWVNQQRWMKVEVIEKVKNGQGVKQVLRPGMRLITRGLGQVVNTREAILRVVSHPFYLCAMLITIDQ